MQKPLLTFSSLLRAEVPSSFLSSFFCSTRYVGILLFKVSDIC